MSVFKTITPSTVAEVRDVFLLLAGGTVGWIVSPSLWLAAFLPRWWALLVMTAAQESSYNRAAVGGVGELGMVQFLPATAKPLMGPDWKARSVHPAWTGYYAARYTQAALLHDLAWWWIAAPIVGPMYMRWLWTHGPSSMSADAAWSGDSAGETVFSHWNQQEVGKASWYAYGTLASVVSLFFYLRFSRPSRGSK